MPLAISRDVFITAAVTGAGATQDRSPHVPRSPRQIADSAIDAARAGAAIVHCHVRDPETGAPSRKAEYYREVTDRIRAADVDVVLNLTTGMGGDLLLGSPDRPLPPREGTDMAGASRAHGAHPGVPAGDLHPGLRHHELRRGRLRDDQHARHAARDGRGDDGARRAGRDRGLRHRPPVVRQGAGGRGHRAPPGVRAALHGHPLGRAGRPVHLPGDGRQRAG